MVPLFYLCNFFENILLGALRAVAPPCMQASRCRGWPSRGPGSSPAGCRQAMLQAGQTGAERQRGPCGAPARPLHPRASLPLTLTPTTTAGPGVLRQRGQGPRSYSYPYPLRRLARPSPPQAASGAQSDPRLGRAVAVPSPCLSFRPALPAQGAEQDRDARPPRPPPPGCTPATACSAKPRSAPPRPVCIALAPSGPAGPKEALAASGRPWPPAGPAGRPAAGLWLQQIPCRRARRRRQASMRPACGPEALFTGILPIPGLLKKRGNPYPPLAALVLSCRGRRYETPFTCCV